MKKSHEPIGQPPACFPISEQAVENFLAFFLSGDVLAQEQVAAQEFIHDNTDTFDGLLATLRHWGEQGWKPDDDPDELERGYSLGMIHTHRLLKTQCILAGAPLPRPTLEVVNTAMTDVNTYDRANDYLGRRVAELDIEDPIFMGIVTRMMHNLHTSKSADRAYMYCFASVLTYDLIKKEFHREQLQNQFEQS